MAYKSNIPQFNARMQKQVDKSLTEVGILVTTKAKTNATKNPKVGTGQLRNSIKYQLSGSGNETNVKIGSNLEYATYQEFGTGEFAENGKGRKGGWSYTDPKTGKRVFTKGNKPTKFLRRAFRDNKSQIETIITESLRGLE